MGMKGTKVQWVSRSWGGKDAQIWHAFQDAPVCFLELGFWSGQILDKGSSSNIHFLKEQY